MHIRDLWFVEQVSEGDVVGSDGRPLRLRTLISRRWGWPKSASAIAADALEMRSHMSGKPWVLHCGSFARRDGDRDDADIARDNQQASLLDTVDGLRAALLEGLAGRTSHERHSGHRVKSIGIVFSSSIVDAGIVARILSAIGDHVGCHGADIRSRTAIHTDGDNVTVAVGLGGLDLDE